MHHLKKLLKPQNIKKLLLCHFKIVSRQTEMTHQQRVDRCESQLPNVLLARGVTTCARSERGNFEHML